MGEVTLEANGKTIPLDDEGYLVDPADWTEDVAEILARREGLALSALHWDLLQFMRRHFEQHQLAPDARFAVRYLAEEQGLAAQARRRLFELFPFGYVKQACKIAGMRRPRAWSTG